VGFGNSAGRPILVRPIRPPSAGQYFVIEECSRGANSVGAAPPSRWKVRAEGRTTSAGTSRVVSGQPRRDGRPPEQRSAPRPLEPMLALPPRPVVHLPSHRPRGVPEFPPQIGDGQPLGRRGGALVTHASLAGAVAAAGGPR